MKSRDITLKRLLDIWDGEIAAPTSLESVIAQLDPSRPDTWVEHLTAATANDFGDVPHLLAALPNLAPELARHLARRLGWTVKVLTDWDPRQDRSRLRIEAALTSAAAWDGAGSFWEVVAPRIGGQRTTTAAFEIVLQGRAPQASVPENAPIWEREHFQALQQAERAGAWARLGERAQAFQRLPRLDIGATQAALALALMDWPRLVRLADRADGWLRGHLLLEPLSLADAFRLATASTSGHVRFAALERVARREVRGLSAAEETALRNLIIVLAKDRDGWPGWLAVCNRFPVHHPHMQVAFGRALARSEQNALRAYVDSISLSTSDTGMRACVTRCLSEFRARAPEARRRELWSKAFNRWRAWDFGLHEGQELTAIASSALDYAVVGWLIEGELRRSSEDLERSFEQDLQALNMRWHGSSNSAISGFFRLLSRHQVLAHAINRSESDRDWLPGPFVYAPTTAADEFIRRRYHWAGS